MTRGSYCAASLMSQLRDQIIANLDLFFGSVLILEPSYIPIIFFAFSFRNQTNGAEGSGNIKSINQVSDFRHFFSLLLFYVNIQRHKNSKPSGRQKITRARNFPHCPETFHSVRKLYRLAGNIFNCPETLQTVRKLSRLSGNFPHPPENFQSVWKLSRLSKNFPDSVETFQTLLKLSRLSEHFSDCPETVRKLSKLSYILSDCLETFQTYAMF